MAAILIAKSSAGGLWRDGALGPTPSPPGRWGHGRPITGTADGALRWWCLDAASLREMLAGLPQPDRDAPGGR